MKRVLVVDDEPDVLRLVHDILTGSGFEASTGEEGLNRVDLSEPGEAVYRDKGYFGARSCGWDATMMRGVRGHPLGVWDRLRNSRIGSNRRPVERVFAVLKRVFWSGHVLVTTVDRVRVKMVFSRRCFNLLQLWTLGVGS